MPDQEHVVSHLSADHLEKVAGVVRSDEQELGRVIVRVDLPCEQRHVDRVRDVLDAVAMLQR